MNLKMGMLALVGGLALLATACTDKGDTIVQTGNVQQTGVSATGTGEAVGKPDVMVVSVGVSAQRESIAEAREAAATAQTAVIDALKRNGVADKDIQTVQFSVNPEYDFSGPGGPRQLVGYVVSNVVMAKVRDLEKAGTVIDQATAAGGNDAVVQGLRFGIDDPTELQKQAREEAVKKAQEQAHQLADNAGAKLGRLLSISESSGSVPFDPNVIRAPATGGGQVDSPIQAGELVVRITVTLLYALE
jgi:uncharacterized protein YggE